MMPDLAIFLIVGLFAILWQLVAHQVPPKPSFEAMVVDAVFAAWEEGVPGPGRLSVKKCGEGAMKQFKASGNLDASEKLRVLIEQDRLIRPFNRFAEDSRSGSVESHIRRLMAA
jgi:hypothetical protein